MPLQHKVAVSGCRRTRRSSRRRKRR